MTKTNSGNFFEDFTLNQTLIHATPRTITAGDVALYNALYGARFALQSSDEVAKVHGFKQSPIDDLLTFHVVFGKSVPDISLNAVANLGYAEVLFEREVYTGDTLSATSIVIGLKENSNRKTGVVYVKTTGINQRGEVILSFIRWVMVNKRDETATIIELVPTFKKSLAADDLKIKLQGNVNKALSGSPYITLDYTVGEKIDHADGVTVEEAEHMLATRLYQNTAKVHFNAHAQSTSRFGKRLIYGGHVISHARALSFNGLGNGWRLAGINAGRHINPLFAGDTIYAWSEILEVTPHALRVKTIATKNQDCKTYPDANHENAILELDYWVSFAG
jgi:2-methylfumaryl-CoA hydratase